MKSQLEAPCRRAFLRTMSAGAFGWRFPASRSPPLHGRYAACFPLARHPSPRRTSSISIFSPTKVKFCNRYKVHGFAWPQIASGWTTLSEQERLSGAEAILAAGKGGKTTLVIGVQTQGNDLSKARNVRQACRQERR